MARRRGYLAILLILVSATYIGTLVPPFQSPDEFDHIERAALLADGQMMLDAPPGQASGGQVDTGLLDYMSYFADLPHDPETRVSPETEAAASVLTWSGESRFETLPGTGYYLPLIYLPQAVGLGVGRVAGQSIDGSYRLARGATLLTGATLLGLAVYLSAPPALTLAFLLLPMTLFQAASASIDFTSSAALVLALALFLKLSSAGTRPSALSLLTLGGLVVLVAGCRIHLAPLVLLPLALAIRFRDVRALALTGIAAVFIVIWYRWALGATVDLRVDTGLSADEILMYYVARPLDFLEVVRTTLLTEHYRLLYWYSFLGILGWLDTYLALSAYRIVGGLLLAIIVVAILARSFRRDPLVAVTLVAIAISAVVLVFLSLLVSWTPHPAEVVMGVQGRYFLPVALVLSALLVPQPEATARAPWAARVESGLLTILLFVSVVSVTDAVTARYSSLPVLQN